MRYELQKIRPSVLERDGHSCTECGANAHLEIHHVISIRNGGSNSLSNLRTVCRKCHRRIEFGSIGEKRKAATFKLLPSIVQRIRITALATQKDISECVESALLEWLKTEEMVVKKK